MNNFKFFIRWCRILLNLSILREYLVLFIIGGITYVLIEISYRGYSHISMFIVGGFCFILVSSLNEFPFEMPLVLQMLISCVLITGIELISGVIVNIFFHMNVWDYSLEKFNFLGQICLKASICWFFLSLPAIYMGNLIKSMFTN